MFDGDVDSSIIIGKPQYRLRGEVETTESGQHEGKSPFVSKIGGYAVSTDKMEIHTYIYAYNTYSYTYMSTLSRSGMTVPRHLQTLYVGIAPVRTKWPWLHNCIHPWKELIAPCTYFVAIEGYALSYPKAGWSFATNDRKRTVQMPRLWKHRTRTITTTYQVVYNNTHQHLYYICYIYYTIL